MMRAMEILDPVGPTTATTRTLAPRPASLQGAVIGVLDNSKPNARELLSGIRDKLSAFRPVDNIDFLSKNSASQGAPKDLLEKVAANYRGALLAIAD